MKALKTTLALLLLGASAAAPAEVICKDCTYTVTDPAAGAYLGAYWPGDRGSFKWRTRFVTAANSFWVIDLNANGTLVFTASTPAAAPFIAFRAELYHDFAATLCNVTPGGFCEQVSFYPLIGCTFIEPGQDQCQQVPFVAELTSPDGVKRWTQKEPLVAGRYVLRVVGQKGATAEAAFSGRVALRK